MSIENVIKEGLADIAAAIRENTAAATGPPTCCTDTPAPAKKKAPKKTAKPKEEKPAEPEATETEVVEEAPAEEVVEETAPEESPDRDAEILKITEYVKERIVNSADRAATKSAFEKLRESYKVELVASLPDDKLAEFYDATVAALPESGDK